MTNSQQDAAPPDPCGRGCRGLAIKGIVPVVQTPFDEPGRLDRESLRRLVQDAIAGGANGFLTSAVASEVACLPVAEREEALADIVAAVAGRVPLIVGASSESVAEGRHLARWAAAQGVAAYLVSVPGALYRKPEALLSFFREVSAGIRLPLIIQDFEINGPGLSLPVIGQLRDAVPTLAGIKVETAPAGPKYTAVRHQLGPEFFLAGGWAVSQFIAALDRGVDAMVPECSMVRIYSTSYRRHLAGNRPEAREIFNAWRPILAFTNQELTISIAFFKRWLVRKGIFSTDRMRLTGFVWDKFNARIADELIEHYLALEHRVSREFV